MSSVWRQGSSRERYQSILRTLHILHFIRPAPRLLEHIKAGSYAGWSRAYCEVWQRKAVGLQLTQPQRLRLRLEPAVPEFSGASGLPKKGASGGVNFKFGRFFNANLELECSSQPSSTANSSSNDDLLALRILLQGCPVRCYGCS